MKSLNGLSIVGSWSGFDESPLEASDFTIGGAGSGDGADVTAAVDTAW
ncbi:hypothetical protein MYCO108962_12875 [Mycobacterium colombiense]